MMARHRFSARDQAVLLIRYLHRRQKRRLGTRLLAERSPDSGYPGGAFWFWSFRFFGVLSHPARFFFS